MHIVLIPGLMNDGWVWHDLVGPLSRVARVSIATTDGCASLTDMADRLLGDFAGELCVIGHSMGGRVALEAVALAPERIIALGLLGTGAHGLVSGEEEGRRALVRLARAEGMTAVARAWLPPMLAVRSRSNPATVDGITRMLERCDPEVFALQQEALLNRPDRSGLLSRIVCPTLLVVGEEDSLFPPALHADMARTIPRSDLHILEHAGHMAPAEVGDAMASIVVDWVKDCDRT